MSDLVPKEVEDSLPEVDAETADKAVFDAHVLEKIDSNPELLDLIKRGGDPIRDEIIKSVNTKSHGRIIHATLMCKGLGECLSVYDLKNTLVSYPESLKVAYIRVWDQLLRQRTGRSSIAKACLLWVINAARPLKMAEFQHGVATNSKTGAYERDNLVPQPSLLPLSLTMIKRDEPTQIMSLIHPSAGPVFGGLLKGTFPHAQGHLARCCLLHFQLRGLNDSPINSPEDLKAVFEKDPLLGYGHENWAYHSLRALDWEYTTDLLKEFLASVKRYPAILPGGEMDHYGPLHLAIEGRIPLSFVRDWESLVNIPTQTKQLTPLALATRLGNQEAIKALSAVPGIRGE